MCDHQTKMEYENRVLIQQQNQAYQRKQARIAALNEVNHYHVFRGYACSLCGMTMQHYKSMKSEDRQICSEV
jgi:hypothetical protein